MDAISQDASIVAEDSCADMPQDDSLETISSGGNMLQELENAGEILTRVELDLACSFEKSLNLNVLVMHVATREIDFEAFVSDGEHELSDSLEKALEFNFLSGILHSEVRELNDSLSVFQTDITHAHEILASCDHLGEAFLEMKQKLHDSEESLRQLGEQVSDLRVQYTNFENILLSFNGEENGKDHNKVEFLENGALLNMSPKINMQTAEQQRHVLRMLEGSLARELELEKMVTESRQIEDDLKLRLEQEIFIMDEEVPAALERVFEAENKSEVLMGISKELLGRLHILHFNLNGLNHREGELRSNLKCSTEMLKAKEIALQKLESTNSVLSERVNSLEKQLRDSEFQFQNAKASMDREKDLLSKVLVMENEINNLREKVSKAEEKNENTDVQCKSLAETNIKLNGELSLLKTEADKVDSLGRQLRDAETKLQHEVACAEAMHEKQTMLYSTIKDMENLIDNLKSRVSKAEILTESVEEKCIILSESNSDLNVELNFVRARMESLEASLLQAEETKKETAKHITIRTKLITDLVMQLALERERLHKQISSLTKENKTLVRNLQHINKNPPLTVHHDDKGNSKSLLVRSHDFVAAASIKGSAKVAADFPVTSFEQNQESQVLSTGETEKELADTTSQLDPVRNIDARQLNIKYVGMAILILVISSLAAFFFQHPDGQI